MTIQVAHDFICPWCWIGYFQADRLEKEFGVTVEWLGYELWPIELDWPAPTPPGPAKEPTNKPLTPTRMQLAYAAEGMDAPTVVRPSQMRTNNAHQALEFAKSVGQGPALNERLYRGLWENGTNINDVEVLRTLASDLLDADEMVRAVQEVRFKDKVVGFDDPAYASGVYNVPTFFIAGERYAEQPYRTLSQAVRAALDKA